MPQLSPLNWMNLYMFFWACILCISAMFWWTSKVSYESPEYSAKMKTLWIWC